MRPGQVRTFMTEGITLEQFLDVYMAFHRSIEHLEGQMRKEQDMKSRLAEEALDRHGRGPHLIGGVMYSIVARNSVGNGEKTQSFFFKRARVDDVKGKPKKTSPPSLRTLSDEDTEP